MCIRMTNPAYVLPDGMKGIASVFKAVNTGGISHELQEFVGLRVSQINGASACVHAHSTNLVKADESADRITALAAWRDTPFYTEAERVALELAEVLTRLGDRSGDAVDDYLWDRVTDHFDEGQVAALLLMIGMTNMVNRLNAAIREPADACWT